MLNCTLKTADLLQHIKKNTLKSALPLNKVELVDSTVKFMFSLNACGDNLESFLNIMNDEIFYDVFDNKIMKNDVTEICTDKSYCILIPFNH